MLDKCIQNDPEEIGTKRVKAIPWEKLLYHYNSTPPLYSLEWDHTPCVETMCNFAAMKDDDHVDESICLNTGKHSKYSCKFDCK